MSITITKWRRICKWRWNVKTDDCGICRNPCNGCCTSCLVPGDECPPSWGVCDHTFHYHCISKWLELQKLCPLCRRVWEYK